MKFSSALITGASLLFAAVVAVAAKEGTSCSSSTAADADVRGCPDPVGAVLALFDCVTKKDSACAAAAYDPGFQRFHNEESTGAIAGEKKAATEVIERSNLGMHSVQSCRLPLLLSRNGGRYLM